jgi:hypothetical protein
MLTNSVHWRAALKEKRWFFEMQKEDTSRALVREPS